MGMCSKKHALRAMCFIVAGLASNASIAMANDVACNAEVVGALPYVPTAADAVNATDDLDTGCNTTTATTTRKGVWYRYNATSNTGLLVTETSGNDAAMAVFVGADCNSLTEIHCSDDPDGIGFPVTAGQSYWILVGIWSTTGNPTTPYALTFSEFASPANDNPCTAQAITSGLSSTVDARTANGNPPVASCGTANSAFGTRHAIWYSMASTPTGGTLNVNETGTSGVVMQLFSGTTCNDLSVVTCTTSQNANFTLAPNTNYWLSIGFNDLDNMPTATGSYITAFTFFPPATNDDCATASELNVTGGSVAVGAMGSAADPDVTCNSGSATGAVAGVWYHINTGLDSGTLSVTEASAEDVVIVIYEGQCGALTQLVCSDAETNISTPLNPNTDYYLMIAKYGTAQPTVPYAFTYTTGIQAGACCVANACQLLTATACAGAGGSFTGGSCTPPNGSNTTATNMPDFVTGGTPTVMEIPLTVADVSGAISSLAVTVNVSHTWVGDVHLQLRAPDNTVVELLGRINTAVSNCPADGAIGNGDDLVGVYTFVDTASQNIRDYVLNGALTVVPSGEYQAANCSGTQVVLNTAFASSPANGTWTLLASDNDDVITGTINSWSIAINGGLTLDCGGGDPTPCELADFNDSGSVTADDIFAFLDAWFAQNGSTGPGFSADINDSDSVTADDIFAFLDLWFAQNGQSCD